METYGRFRCPLLFLTEMVDLSVILYKIAQALPGFLLAIVVHEWAHGYMALKFGDDTAQRAGRLTLNPVAHIDLMGTVIFPLIGVVLGWAVIGWAKPVPVDSRNFKPKEADKAIFWVSFAGPLSNLILGILSAFGVAAAALYLPQSSGFYSPVISALKYSVFINFLLCVFNLIPLPPLDGSKMVASFMGYNLRAKYLSIQAYTPMIFMGIIALSMMGISTIGWILAPAIGFGSYLEGFFLQLLGA